MALNNKDRWLIRHWNQLLRLELAMGVTRQQMEGLFREIHEKVRQSHPALDRLDLHFSAKEIENYGGNAVFSRGSWPADLETWRTGIYVVGVTLDELTSEKSSGPSFYVYFLGKRSDSRIEKFKRQIANAAPRVFKDSNIHWNTNDEEDDRTLLWYVLPEGKGKLLKMLGQNGEQDFVECIAHHVGLLCGFIPVLDKFFAR